MGSPLLSEHKLSPDSALLHLHMGACRWSQSDWLPSRHAPTRWHGKAGSSVTSSALQGQCQRLQAEAQQARGELAEAVQAATATREAAWQEQLQQEQHERQHAQQHVQARLCVADMPLSSSTLLEPVRLTANTLMAQPRATGHPYRLPLIGTCSAAVDSCNCCTNRLRFGRQPRGNT